jgi:hypothetical protein
VNSSTEAVAIGRAATLPEPARKRGAPNTSGCRANAQSRVKNESVTEADQRVAAAEQVGERADAQGPDHHADEPDGDDGGRARAAE